MRVPGPPPLTHVTNAVGAGGGGDDGENESNLSVSFTEETHTMQKIGHALSVIQDKQLRVQLRDILAINDAVAGGATKTALLNILNLKRATEAFGVERGVLDRVESPIDDERERGLTPQTNMIHPSAGGVRSMSAFMERIWVPPAGRGSRVPRHLRSRHSVPVIPFHPLVAECFIHEILSQRQEWIDRALQEERSAAEWTPENPFHFDPEKIMPLEDFIQLFVNVVWLNREDRFLPLLPDQVRLEIVEHSRRAEKRSRLSPVTTPTKESSGSPKKNKRSSPKKNGSSSPKKMTAADEGGQAAAPPSPSKGEYPMKLNPDPPGMGGARPSVSKVTASLTPALRCRLHCLIHAVRPSEKMLRLPEEGLRLTYSLDMASRRPDAGFLTQTYGLISRLEVGEVLLDVMRHDRDVFLNLCKLVDQHREDVRAAEFEEAKKAVLRERHRSALEALLSPEHRANVAGASSMASSTSSASTLHTIREKDHQWTLRGCIPLVSIAQILMAMYPTYPVKRIEQLVIAATEDGTDSSESPVMIYYSLLLPERLLPGVAQSKDEAMSFWHSGAFSSLFFLSIADDVMESLQMVEDSFANFGRTFDEQVEGEKELVRTTANPTATAKQIVTVGLQGIPYEELQKWRTGLESIIFTWPRLQKNTFDDDLSGDSASNTPRHIITLGGMTPALAASLDKSNNTHSTLGSKGPGEASAATPAPHGQSGDRNPLSAPLEEQLPENASGGLFQEALSEGELTLNSRPGLGSRSHLPTPEEVYQRYASPLSGNESTNKSGFPNQQTVNPMSEMLAKVSNNTRVPIMDAMRHLRQHVALRRGPNVYHTLAPEDTEAHPSGNSLKSPASFSRVPGAGVQHARDSDFLNVSLSTSEQREMLWNMLDEEPPLDSGWGEEHMQYTRLLMKRWVKYCAGNEAAILRAVEIIEKLRELDPDREKIWVSPLLGQENPFVQWINPMSRFVQKAEDVDEVAAAALKAEERRTRKRKTNNFIRSYAPGGAGTAAAAATTTAATAAPK